MIYSGIITDNACHIWAKKDKQSFLGFVKIQVEGANMDWVRMIQNAINYIENHIFDDIDQDELAKNAYSSVFQFNRAFSMIAGISISEYIRNRRLSIAGRELRDGKEKVIDIALKYGYDSHESFTKAFKRFHGESPSAVRASRTKIRFYKPLTIQINVKGGFDMEKKFLTDIRDLIDGMQGHNYALPDCIKYIFERMGDYEYLDFWNIAAVTGDTIAQVYNHNLTTSCEYCVSGYLAGAEYIAYIFDVFGYAHEYATAKQIIADKEKYRRKIVDYIDKGIPVLVKTNLNDIPAWNLDVGTYCLVIGYENDGDTVKLLVSDKNTIDYEINNENKIDLIFIGEKQREVTLEEICIKIIKKMPYWLTLPERDGMHFGAAAYRKWADDVESGKFTDDNLHFMNWENYGVYVCNLATSGVQHPFYFKKLTEINPKYTELANVGEKINKLLPSETPTGGRSMLWIQLEELNGGMDMGKVKETMYDKEKRLKIAAILRDYAERFDQAVDIMNEEIHQL
jgi:AraC-like DNA-binding protein